jgi:integrase/recombinase XerD
MNTEQHLIAFKNYMNYRRYSENTIKTYSDALEVFFRFFQNKKLESLTIEDIIHFNND